MHYILLSGDKKASTGGVWFSHYSRKLACKLFPPWTKSFSPPLAGFRKYVFYKGQHKEVEPTSGHRLVLLAAGSQWPNNKCNKGLIQSLAISLFFILNCLLLLSYTQHCVQNNVECDVIDVTHVFVQ